MLWSPGTFCAIFGRDRGTDRCKTIDLELLINLTVYLIWKSKKCGISCTTRVRELFV